ncbi:hypothetical protein Tco_1446224 [Tanacetum coccineum]
MVINSPCLTDSKELAIPGLTTTGGYTPECDEDRKKLIELTELCTKLSEKVTSLEQDLKQTKQVYETEHVEEESSKVHLDVLKRLSKATPEEEVLTV